MIVSGMLQLAQHPAQLLRRKIECEEACVFKELRV